MSGGVSNGEDVSVVELGIGSKTGITIFYDF